MQVLARPQLTKKFELRPAISSKQKVDKSKVGKTFFCIYLAATAVFSQLLQEQLFTYQSKDNIRKTQDS